MARPTKEGIDYFPFDVDFFSDMKVRRIKKACGPASISVLICLLCNIYRDGYYILWNEDLSFVIAEIIGVTEGAVSEMILKSVNVGFFNGDMFSRYKILTSRGTQKRYLNVIKSSKLKREGIKPEYNLLENSEKSDESAEEINKSSEETTESSEESTQSKVKQSKEIEYIVAYLNEKTGKGFKANTKDTVKHIQARLKEGYAQDDFIRVIDIKAAQWGNDPKWSAYLRPSTLFGTKFEAYLNEGGAMTSGGNDPYGGIPEL